MQKVAIIGAGIIGTAIANEVARAGNRATVFSLSKTAKDATPNSFGWVNAHSPDLKHHFVQQVFGFAG